MAAGSEELSIIVRMRDFATKQFNSLSGTIGKWAQSGVQKVGQFVKSMLSFHGILGMIGTAWGAMRMIDHVAEVEDIGLAFESLTKKVGGSEAILSVLRKATRGTVSDFKLMETANKAVLLGVGDSAEQFEMLATLARRLGRAVGRDTVDAFNDLTMGIGRQSRLILDNLGLIVKVEEANEAYAKALGVTASSLTESQKKQAFMNATMEAARVKVAELGDDTWTMSDAWGSFKATLSNLANDILTQTLPALTELFTNLRTNMASNREAIMNFAADVVEGLGTIADVGGPILDVLLKVGKSAVKLPKDIESAWGSLHNLFGLLKDQNVEVWGAAEDAEKSMKSVGEGLIATSKKIREAGRADLEVYRHASKVIGNFRKEVEAFWNSGDLSKRFRDAESFLKAFQKFSYKPIDVGGKRAAELETEIAAHNELYDAMKRVQELRARYDFSPPLIEPPKADETAVYKQREQFEWMAKAYAEMERTDIAAGAAKGFTELAQRSTEWGTATYEAVMQASGAISYNLVDGIIAIGKNFKEAGKIAREFTAQLLEDLARIILQLAMVQAVQAGMGALGGALGLGGSGSEMMPFKFRARGGYIPRPEFAVVGESGPELVHLPGGSRVYPTSQSFGKTVNVTITNNNPSFRTEEQERTFSREQQAQIRGVVLEAMSSSTGFREGMA